MKINFRYRFTLIAISFLMLSTMACQQRPKSDIDLIKSFKPSDKYFKSSLMSLHFIIETSPIDRVDSVFQQIINTYDLPVSAKGIPDGTYSAVTPADAFDYQHIVTITIKNENIVSVDYNETRPEGKGKEEDADYCKEMKPAGTTPAIAYPIMEEQLLEKQNMMEVDAVSGATYSLYRMRHALTIALMKASLEQRGE